MLPMGKRKSKVFIKGSSQREEEDSADQGVLKPGKRADQGRERKGSGREIPAISGETGRTAMTPIGTGSSKHDYVKTTSGKKIRKRKSPQVIKEKRKAGERVHPHRSEVYP